jgi:dTDP-4-amino-4,6-dideoxygalactose transaminase
MSLQDRINFPQKDTKFYQSLIDDALQSIINSGQLILGPGVKQFESDFAKWLSHDIEAVHCIGVGNGTDAIELALRAAGIQAGDHVALPAHTAYATVAAVLRVAAIPIFIDVQSDRPVISAETLAHTLSICKSVKAVIAVHLYGEVCDLESIQSLCNLNHLTLIEDCAQATGSLYRNYRVGTFGDFAAFSFYPTKNLGAMGDGGMLVVNPRIHQNQLEIARQMRFYGWNDNREADNFGVNSRLDEFQALLLSGKLHNLDLQIERRRELAALYNFELKPYLGNQIIDLPSDQDPVSGRFAAVRPVSRLGRGVALAGPRAGAGGPVLHQHARWPDSGTKAAAAGKERHEADHHDYGREAFGVDAGGRADL